MCTKKATNQFLKAGGAMRMVSRYGYDSVRNIFTRRSRSKRKNPEEEEPQELSDFQKKKLCHEFHTFYDFDKDGQVSWKDLNLARENLCKVSGWKEGSDKFKETIELFIAIWQDLQCCADLDLDGTITEEDWLNLWKETLFPKQKPEMPKKEEELEGSTTVTSGASETNLSLYGDGIEIPTCLDRFIEYKFKLIDRSGDNVIDIDEFEYVLSIFDVPPKECRAAFTLLTQSGSQPMTLEHYKALSIEFYLTDDPTALGNFINGKFTYD